MKKAGTLYIVATPIGNLADITLRAITTLNQVDLIAAEDTRHSKKLLNHYAIKTKLISLHEYNEEQKSHFIIDQLIAGKNIGLISDAGTPLISDPGFQLINLVKKSAIPVTAIPGPSALITALSISGLPTDRFTFEGFLSAKSQARIKDLQKLITEDRTMIFYESPHRLLDTIEGMITVFGGKRFAVIAKELTKTFETIYCGTLAEIINWLTSNKEHQKGEFVILVKGAEQKPQIDSEAIRIFNILKEELSHKQAAALTAEITGINKNHLYKAFL